MVGSCRRRVPAHAGYQENTDRLIPVLVASPAG